MALALRVVSSHPAFGRMDLSDSVQVWKGCKDELGSLPAGAGRPLT